MSATRPAYFILLLSICLFTCIGALTSLAASKGPPPPPDLRKMVKSVDVKKSSVVIQNMRDKTLHSYTIDARTVVMVNNQARPIDQIKPGMVVDDFLERYNDTLDSLSVSGYPADPVKPKAPSKPKPKPPGQ